MQGKVFYEDEDVWQSKCVTVKRTIENFESESTVPSRYLDTKARL